MLHGLLTSILPYCNAYVALSRSNLGGDGNAQAIASDSTPQEPVSVPALPVLCSYHGATALVEIALDAPI